jgi:hypothetical protein
MKRCVEEKVANVRCWTKVWRSIQTREDNGKNSADDSVGIGGVFFPQTWCVDEHMLKRWRSVVERINCGKPWKRLRGLKRGHRRCFSLQMWCTSTLWVIWKVKGSADSSAGNGGWKRCYVPRITPWSSADSFSTGDLTPLMDYVDWDNVGKRSYEIDAQ